MSSTRAGSAEVADGFQVRWVFGCIDDALRQQLVAFWLQEKALASADEAWRRTAEVACVLLEGEDEAIAGVCTVAVRLDDQGRSFGFVRIFIRAGSRRTGLGRRLMRRMIEGFSAIAREPGAPLRLLATIENHKLDGRGARRLLATLGFVEIGIAENGEKVIERTLVP
jgi:GNAT superfamily N-acetyltransferase